jgi:hypothetical protein
MKPKDVMFRLKPEVLKRFKAKLARKNQTMQEVLEWRVLKYIQPERKI